MAIQKTNTIKWSWVIAGMALVLVAVFPDLLMACPTCKENLADDPAAANIVKGYFWSIIFMLSMPPAILIGLVSYFYYQVCKARAEGKIHTFSPEVQAALDGNA